jgi:hypothetical protein
MKKIIFLAIIAIMAIGCSKSDIKPDEIIQTPPPVTKKLIFKLNLTDKTGYPNDFCVEIQLSEGSYVLGDGHKYPTSIEFTDEELEKYYGETAKLYTTCTCGVNGHPENAKITPAGCNYCVAKGEVILNYTIEPDW